MRAARSPQRVAELDREAKRDAEGRPVGRVRVRQRVIVWCDAEFAAMFGYAPSELLGMPTRALHPSDEVCQAFAAAAFPVIARGDIYRTELQQRRKNGTLGWYDVSVHLLTPGGEEQVGAFIDVTSRRELWTALLGAEQHYRSLFAVMAEGVVVHAQTGEVIEANPAAESILGLSRSQILGRTPRDPDWQAVREDGTPFPGDEHPASITLRTGMPVRNRLMGVKPAGSEMRWININSCPLYAPGSSAPAAVIATFVDVTAQRRMTEDLNRARAALRTTLDRVPAMVGYWNSSLRCEFANRAYMHWFGVPVERAVGLHMSELIGVELFKMNEPYAQKALLGQPQHFERRVRKPDGSIAYSEVRYIPDVDEGGAVRGFHVLATDITALRDSYARVRAFAQRLEMARDSERQSLARALHEGIAQDLFAAKLTLDHLKANSPDGALPWRELGDTIDSCMRSASELANEVRPSALVHLDIAEAIAEHARAVEAVSGLSIRISQVARIPTLEEPARLVLFRAAQEALTNVVRHANASGVHIVLGCDARRVTMHVLDDGCGIADDALAKPGALGLLGLRERLEALGGALHVAREARSGTRLSVRLPRACPAPGPP